MKHLLLFIVLSIAGIFMNPAVLYAQADEQIKQAIIEESIQNYTGNCPCPYNTDRAGRRCGKRSAYSRPGGASPICYPEDITPEILEAYKKRKR